MEEIKTVIDRLKEKYEKLDSENTADLNSINEKQANISSLNAEIDNLQKQIESRKENMAILEAKKTEAESFDKSIEEVAPLIDKEEVKEEPTVEVEETKEEETAAPVLEEEEEVKEEVSEAVQEEVTPEPEEAPTLNPTEEADNNMVFPFGDITNGLETKEEPFEFKSNMDEFNAPEEEVTPIQEEVNPEVSFASPTNGPIFDERGFDISANLNQPAMPSTELPNIGLNEMYNAPMEEDTSMMLR